MQPASKFRYFFIIITIVFLIIYMANRFVLNETSYHGKGAIESIPEEAKARGFKKALVCSDPDLVKFGVTAKVTDLLDKAGLAYELYSNIKPNPTIENVQQGVKALHDAGADYMIAIGGGSSMDTAKAVGIIDKASLLPVTMPWVRSALERITSPSFRSSPEITV